MTPFVSKDCVPMSLCPYVPERRGNDKVRHCTANFGGEVRRVTASDVGVKAAARVPPACVLGANGTWVTFTGTGSSILQDTWISCPRSPIQSPTTSPAGRRVSARVPVGCDNPHTQASPCMGHSVPVCVHVGHRLRQRPGGVGGVCHLSQNSLRRANRPHGRAYPIRAVGPFRVDL